MKVTYTDAAVIDALKNAKNTLKDYIQTLEAKGASLYYGRSVIVKIDKALKILGVKDDNT